MREWFSVEAAAKGKGGGEILIYGVIGRSFWGEKDGYVPAKEFITALDKMIAAGPGDVHLRINSPGGDVWDGTAIYNGIMKHKDRCYATIEGAAFSMASVIALAARETRMYETAQFMIHNPKTYAYGEEKDLASAQRSLKTAKTALLTAYTAKTGKSEQEISDAMDATTWMTAEEAKDWGFVDEVLTEEAPSMAACFDVTAWESHYRDGTPLPDSIEAQAVPAETKQPMGSTEATEIKPMKLNEIKAACPGATAEFVMAQFELCEANENRTVAEVATAFAVEQTKALEAERAALAAAKAELEASKKTPPPAAAPGVPAIQAGGATDDSDGNPVDAYDELVEKLVAQGKTKAVALRTVAVKHPEIHKAYLAAFNFAAGRPVA